MADESMSMKSEPKCTMIAGRPMTILLLDSGSTMNLIRAVWELPLLSMNVIGNKRLFVILTTSFFAASFTQPRTGLE